MVRGTRILQLALILAASVAAAVAWAGPYDPPPTYYNSATGTGATLKQQLDTIMTNNNVLLTYGDARYILNITDQDPSNSSNVLLTYNRNSVSGTWVGNGTGVFGSREHVWPQSRFPEDEPDVNNGYIGMGSDLHMLKPLDPGTNSNRGNRAFGFAATTGANRKLSDDDYYFPGMADRGDMARILFYGATRWKDEGLNLVNGAGVVSNQEMGDLASLLEWHYLDVPDTFELRRNHLIFGEQGNRNAYIDRPEFVWSVYVDQQNDSQLYVGGSPAADGGSTFSLGFNPVIVGAAVPAAQTVTLHKNGFDGTYFEVTTSGLATSSVTGRYNAFANNSVSTDSRNLSIGLSTTTATAGLKSGSVVVNNLDVTTAGGTGRGDNDADDTINVSLAVFDHANPSFLGGSDQNTLTLDFGTVTQGATAPTMNFDISNLVDTASFTAGLELDSILGSGDVGVLTTDLATFTGGGTLTAGTSNIFTASLDTLGMGSFSASYTLSFSDENLPGATSLGNLTLNLVGEVTAPVENADFNGDLTVDGDDFLIWQRGLGVGTTLTEGDANDDHLVNAADLAIWEDQYGPAPLTATVSVPEPSALLLVLGSLSLALGRRRSPHLPYST